LSTTIVNSRWQFKSYAPLKLNLRGVHETFANWGSEFVVFGLGGKLNETIFEEDFVVKYPRWYADSNLSKIPFWEFKNLL
jgi:hypothetical protein